ncbi:hypothetical protein ACFX1Q_046456 [Malus domestica]
MPEFGGGEEHGKTELLNGGIIDLRWIKISTEVKIACSRPASLSWARRQPMDSSAAEIYSLRGLPRRGGTRTCGVVRETLICVNAA